MAVLGLCGCADGTPGVREGLLSGEVERLIVEVHYQPDASPHVGSTGRAWDLTRVNLEALVQAAAVEVVVPGSQQEMYPLPASGDIDYTADELLELVEEHRQARNSGSQRVFSVLLLDGYYADEDGREDQVLGVSLGDTGVVALFERVVAASGTALVRTFVEQSTLMHEIGHAVGLVNNGLPMVTSHQDRVHGNHCTNPDCVMYYLNEGGSDLVEFVRRLQNGDAIVFGDECLADAHAQAR